MPEIPDDLEVRVPFTVPEIKQTPKTDYVPSYSDVLFIPAGEFRALTWNEIEERKSQRYYAWLDAIRNPAPVEDPVAPSANEVLAQARDALTQALGAVAAVQESQTAEA